MMTVDLDFWWLIFPLFGIVMAIIGCARENSGDEAMLRDAFTTQELDQ